MLAGYGCSAIAGSVTSPRSSGATLDGDSVSESGVADTGSIAGSGSGTADSGAGATGTGSSAGMSGIGSGTSGVTGMDSGAAGRIGGVVAPDDVGTVVGVGVAMGTSGIPVPLRWVVVCGI